MLTILNGKFELPSKLNEISSTATATIINSSSKKNVTYKTSLPRVSPL